MADPDAIRLADAFRLLIAAGDAATTADLVYRWLPVERQLREQIQALAEHFAALAERGETVSADAVARDARFRALLAQLQLALNDYGAEAERVVDDGQRRRAAEGWQHAQALTRSVSGVGISLDRLPVEAVANIVSLARAGKPLSLLMEARYPLAAQGMLDRLITGTALGWNPRKTARSMMEQGVSKGLNHVLLVARDQQLRAYRTASLQAYRQSGFVIGYKRLAARQPRTCLACLALDGKFYRLDEEMPLHPQDRCLAEGQRVTTSRGEIPIEGVSVGDVVLTQYGRWQPVTATARRWYSGEMIRLRQDGRELLLTPDHRILTQRGWVAAAELIASDTVVTIDSIGSIVEKRSSDQP